MSEPAHSGADNAGVVLPPPLVGVVLLVLSLVGDWLWAPHVPAPWSQYLVGAAMIVAAVFLLLAASGSFRRANTDVRPWKTTSMIATDGVYRFTRNPMYLGMVLAFAGIALVLNRPYALLGLPVFMVFLDFGVIRREERYLEGKFGEDYRQYRERVRRWI